MLLRVVAGHFCTLCSTKALKAVTEIKTLVTLGSPLDKPGCRVLPGLPSGDRVIRQGINIITSQASGECPDRAFQVHHPERLLYTVLTV